MSDRWREYLELAEFEKVLLGFFASRSLTAHSEGEYRADFRVFREWCENVGLRPLTVSEAEANRFLDSTKAQGRASATIERYRGTINQLFEYLRKEAKLRPDNPFENIPAIPRQRSDEKDYLRRDELAAMLEEAKRDSVHLAMFALLAINGLSLEEIAGTNVDDLNMAGDPYILWLPSRGSEASTMLPPVTRDAVQPLTVGRSTGPLVTTKAGDRVTRAGLFKRLKLLAARAGIERKVTQHTVHRGAALLAHERGASQHQIARTFNKSTVAYLVPAKYLDRKPSRETGYFIADALSGREGQGGIIEVADRFLLDNGIHPAIPTVIVGVALEMHLRELVEQSGLTTSSKNPGIEAYNNALRHKVLTNAYCKKISVWADWRTKAAHGLNLEELSAHQVREMLDGVRKFIVDYPAS